MIKFAPKETTSNSSQDGNQSEEGGVSYFFMDQTVKSNVIRLLLELKIYKTVSQVLKEEPMISMYTQIGRRLICLKQWAIDEIISNEDYEMWKQFTLYIGYQP